MDSVYPEVKAEDFSCFGMEVPGEEGCVEGRMNIARRANTYCRAKPKLLVTTSREEKGLSVGISCYVNILQ